MNRNLLWCGRVSGLGIPVRCYGRVRLIEADALSALRELPAVSQDSVESAYTVHHFFDA